MPSELGHSLEKFLLPDPISLKVIFDNVRNSLIASTFVTGGFWVRQFLRTPTAKGATDAQSILLLLANGLVWLGFILMVLNLMQILVISRHSRALFTVRREISPRHQRGVSAIDLLVEVLVAALLLLIQLSAASVFSLAILRGLVGAP